MEVALAKRLRSRPDLQQGNVEVILLPTGGVALSRAKVPIGVWVWRAGEFSFDPATGVSPVTAQTIMGAIALTSAIIDVRD